MLQEGSRLSDALQQAGDCQISNEQMPSLCHNTASPQSGFQATKAAVLLPKSAVALLSCCKS